MVKLTLICNSALVLVHPEIVLRNLTTILNSKLTDVVFNQYSVDLIHCKPGINVYSTRYYKYYSTRKHNGKYSFTKHYFNSLVGCSKYLVIHALINILKSLQLLSACMFVSL